MMMIRLSYVFFPDTTAQNIIIIIIITRTRLFFCKHLVAFPFRADGVAKHTSNATPKF